MNGPIYGIKPASNIPLCMGDFFVFQRPHMVTTETLMKLLESCRSWRCLIQLHPVTIKAGLREDTLFTAKLIDLYLKFTSFRTARKLFDEIPQRDVCFWSRILKCYCEEKRYKELLSLFSPLFLHKKPDIWATRIALKACAEVKALDYGKIIHGFVKKSDIIDRSLFVGAGLIRMYSKCGEMDDALCVFGEHLKPDTVVWATMIAGYNLNGAPRAGLEFFAEMVRTEGVVLDSITLVSVVSACAQTLNLRAGRSVHGYIIRAGLDKGLSLLNALLSMYGKMGLVNAAVKVFERMEEKDVISWGCMVACHAHHGGASEALDLFDEMVVRGIEPNVIVLISALQACEASGDLGRGKRVHELVVRKGLELDVLVSTALIDMYMRCFCPDEAIQVFERMFEKDDICFAALLHGCVENGRMHKSLGVFCNMLAYDFRPNNSDVIKILTACSELGVLQQTSCIHGFTIRIGLSNNSFIGASLIESYAKCGSLDEAVVVFKQTRDRDRDVVTWSSMLAAYGLHGKGVEALELFHQMIKHSYVRPNDVSFVSILSACSHAGLIKEGINVFNLMVKDYELVPNAKHYSILVDLLGRVGELDKAMALITQMPEPIEGNIWAALLSACRIHQNMEIGEIAAKKLLELDPCQASHYILLSNMYAAEAKWVNVAEVRTILRQKDLKVVSGQSVVKVRDEFYTFIANDRSHQDFVQIYEMLAWLEGKLREYNDMGSSICRYTLVYD